MNVIIILDNNSPEIQYLCKKDKRLAKVISMIDPITYETHDEDLYEFLIHEIIEQMLSIKAGNKIFSRLVDLCDGKITPSKMNKLKVSELQIPKYLLSEVLLTLYLMVNCFNSLKEMNDSDVFKYLTSFKGIGKWIANMYLIFVLNRMDILPTNDAAFLQSYEWLYKTTDRSEISIRKKWKKWKPYSSIAYRYLYRALDSGLTKTKFYLYK